MPVAHSSAREIASHIREPVVVLVVVIVVVVVCGVVPVTAR